MPDVYHQLAEHLESLVMGYPFNDALPELLKEMFTPQEAQVALSIPTGLPPLKTASLETIAAGCGLPRNQVASALTAMDAKAVLFTAPTSTGEAGYALLQVGYGVPQRFFWGGDTDERAKTMAKRVMAYFDVETTGKVYGATPTKGYKYTPAGLAVEVPMQGVLPQEEMGSIVAGAQKIAVAHCPCRMSAKILGRTDCDHPLEVCLKYDEMAEFVIAKGLAREISGDEAMAILEQSERQGLVHMVDNAQGGIKHTCNCCGHYCWNVGIINRRKIPRDQLMDVYFIRQTEAEECIGCGACVDICPVRAVTLEDDVAVVDQDWCIGCGVCAVPCPTEAISLTRRREDHAPQDFAELHTRIAREKGLL